MRAALYPGSFDPITYGHLDIVRRARKVFDKLTIAVVENPRKEALFSPEERRGLVEQALQEEGIGDVPVITYSGLLIECAKRLGVVAIVRGLRATSDFDYEFQMALTNRDLDSDIETVFFMTAGRFSFLSSSIVKEVKRYGGDVSKFVPRCVERALEEKFNTKGSGLYF
ncbi:MAG: Phosphopantetheine adenylyltransferase [Acetothermia bacterium 64_32]|nr:MAG: Phosphopantetheine adenylyltransferase [Acetothermia bacterium 64_32]MBC7098885.1 pantetheine-phosphate adenylyltransferase [Candidatus Bipolaricaulota bacterium]HAF69849.1 pantetheine-phosphate adenylyltransferase [Candidatus Acetothermia bacterium]